VTDITDWKIKYKICRAAFMARAQIFRQESKIATKDRNRIIQHCYDGMVKVDMKTGMLLPPRLEPQKSFERILAVLGVKGYEGV
jgi:hypothetical protein